ncbi:MAG: CapA family protein [Candidatus Pacebacteria bacterium]|nr:CapA family protein [Candidatus Paceibacterota bacterium]
MTSKLILLILTVASVFSGQSRQTVDIYEHKEANNTRILHLGDIMLGRHVGARIAENKDPFLFVHKELSLFDAVIGNLEGPITDTESCQKKPYSFKFATTTASLLAHHNIHGVSLANNHSYDCFSRGLIDTRAYLAEENIFYFGGGGLKDSYASVNIQGKDIVFMGIDRSIGDIAIKDLYAQVEEIVPEHNFIIVYIHWGNEYEIEYSEEQQIIAHNLIDKGVDVIIGHHPHVMQPAEIYKGKPVFYSLGNFIFDQNEEETTKGYAVSMTFLEKDIAWEVKPYGIIHTRPAFLRGKTRDLVCDRILVDVEEREGCVFEVSI